MLSPTLFNIFLHDLPEVFYDEESQLTVVNNSPVKCLLYADDLVIMSTSENGLQHQLHKLKYFCDTSNLSVNLDKSKIMVFNNTGKRLLKYKFYFDQKKLENVKTYKYLGLQFCSFGTFTSAREELKKVALKALFKLRRDMGNNFRTDITLTIRLFDSLIKPILLYGSEIWGAEIKKNMNNDPLESV